MTRPRTEGAAGAHRSQGRRDLTGKCCFRLSTPEVWKESSKAIEMGESPRQGGIAAMRGWRLPATSALIGMVSVIAIACGTVNDDPQAACNQAVAQAMAIDPGSDIVQAVDGAMADCGSIKRWVIAAKQYLYSFGEQDPAAYALERGGASATLARSGICAEGAGEG